jgi:hypothetical protein
MTATAHSRGHLIYHDGQLWRYYDGRPLPEEWPCARCGRFPTKDGHDACLGILPDVKSACCGHGVETPFSLKE